MRLAGCVLVMMEPLSAVYKLIFEGLPQISHQFLAFHALYVTRQALKDRHRLRIAPKVGAELDHALVEDAVCVCGRLLARQRGRLLPNKRGELRLVDVVLFRDLTQREDRVN